MPGRPRRSSLGAVAQVLGVIARRSVIRMPLRLIIADLTRRRHRAGESVGTPSASSTAAGRGRRRYPGPR